MSDLNYIADQNNSGTAETFQLLIQQKIQEKRNKKLKVKKPPAWGLVPKVTIMKYYRVIRKIMQQYTTITIRNIKPLLQEWVRENNAITGDDVNIKRDSPVDELEELNNQFNAQQAETFEDNNTQLKLSILSFGLVINEFNKKQWAKVVNQSLGINYVPVTAPWEEPVLKGWTNRNVNLIKGLTDDYVKQINETVLKGFNQGTTADELARQLSKVNKNFTGNRSRLIARDQVNKLNGAMTRRRQRDAGVALYIWRTAGDERVRGNPSGLYPKARPSHSVMNGKVCRWDNPMLYADTIEEAQAGKWKQRSSIGGVELHPGFAIQCRCSAEAVFLPVVEEAEKNTF